MKESSSTDLISSPIEEVVAIAINHPSSAIQIDLSTVVKRDGTIVPFRRERIRRAIDLAFHDTKKIASEAPLPELLQRAAEEVAHRTINQLASLVSKGVNLTVEGIQDLVETILMKMGHHDVARDYILYRDGRKKKREESPSLLRICRKDGSLVRFNPMKIGSSIEQAFRRAEEIRGQTPDATLSMVNSLTQKVVEQLFLLHQQGEELSIESVEDLIELFLMQEGHFKTAKNYILFRASTSLHENKKMGKEERRFKVATGDGKLRTITEKHLRHRLQLACDGIPEVSVEELLEQLLLQFYEGIKENEIDWASIMAARAKIEMEPNYSKVAARLLNDKLYQEAIEVSSYDPSITSLHQTNFVKYIKLGISLNRLSASLLEFDLDLLSRAIDLKRDDLFSYLGLQTLYDRYFIHHRERRIETPQMFWMRIAMGLAIHEGKKKNQYAIQFYDLLSQFLFTSATPTLFNSGTPHSQLSSCYLSTVMDDLSHIFKVIGDDAQLSKWAGGIGNDWSNVRATGSLIQGTNGKSQGVIPFLKVANDTAVAVNQCFAPETAVYTSEGATPIADIVRGDLVLGISGRYREVVRTFSYPQKGAMVSIQVEGAFDPLLVTASHPLYALPQSSLSNSFEEKDISFQWTEATHLKKGDYIAQILPREKLLQPGIEREDIYIYGIFLTARSYCEGNRVELEFPSYSPLLSSIRNYLHQKGLFFSERVESDGSSRIIWYGEELLLEATSGRAVSDRTRLKLPFYSEEMDSCGKQIPSSLSHLPEELTLLLLQGFFRATEAEYREGSISCFHRSPSLMEGIRYQLLRLGISPKRAEKDEKEPSSPLYRIEIPSVDPIASLLGYRSVEKDPRLFCNGHLCAKISSVEITPTIPLVYDLKVEGDESYMTSGGLAHNGGKRKGAICAYLETWHLDIEDFLDLRKNTGDERRRTHDINTANWIPDLFMKRVMQKGTWTLFSPSDVPDLHHLYGKSFEKRYEAYEKMAEEGKIELYKQVEAASLWRKMLSMLFETGHPWITFKDPSNIRSPQDHAGVIHNSNLCTEILLNTSAEETAVCNLGSINLSLHCTPTGIDEKKLAETIATAVRMLDNVIDINFYPTVEAKRANERHRPIGLGVMGFQDCLYIQNISYASHEAVEFSDATSEMISYYAILTSTELARERGVYSSYPGSKWDRGYLPIDTLDLLEKEREGHLDLNKTVRMDWAPVRAAIKKDGMRNSNLLAIAPTATISNITGVTQSIEPTYKHLFVKSNLSGEFTIPNLFLVKKLKSLRLWDQEMLDDLKYFDGSIAEIERIPAEIKRVYLTAFEIAPEWIIEAASRRQKWIDMGQSLNLYIAEPNGKKLDQMYFLAWEKGLKTTYYLRSVAATQIEKSTTDINKRGLQPRWMKNKSASSNIQVIRENGKEESIVVCNIDDESCESCQ